MKKIFYSAALLGLAVLTACSGGSPSAKPVPTVVPTTWNIASLDVSNTTPYVGSSIQVDATVTKNGSPAPDGTIVEFIASGGVFFSSDGTEANVETAGGVASALFAATDAGTYTIQARVEGTTRQKSVSYSNPPTDDSLQIIQPLIPNIGSYDGGETVILQGKGIHSSVEVDFSVGGLAFPAVVVNVLDSSKAATGSITILTPYISGEDLRGEDREAGVTVRTGLTTGNEQTQFLPAAFTFRTGFVPGGAPGVFAVIPDTGSSSGGETVVIRGRNFVPDDTVVRWIGAGIDLVSSSVTVSPDGLEIDAITPKFSLGPIEEPIPLTVEVTTSDGSSSLANAFLVLADEPTPAIASISPIAGPLDGGTLVTIFGSGFTGALTVTFGDLSAVDVNIFDDTSIADNDRITCLSPDYSQQGESPPAAVQVQVTNAETGKQSNTKTFTYGDNLYITGNSPSEGRIGDEVTIFGSGFEDPLQIFYDVRDLVLEEQEVSGTQIRARFPADTEVFCGQVTGNFRVKMLESNLETSGGEYTLLGNTPRVTSVSPVFVTASESGNLVNPDDIVITGAHFSAEVLVSINDYTMAADDVDVVSESTIEVRNIPAPNDFNFSFNTSACLTNQGQDGTREEPTPVTITVTNIPGGCLDSLVGGLIYEPATDECVAAGAIAVETAAVFPPTEHGLCSAATTPLTVENTGAGVLELFSASIVGSFEFSGGATDRNLNESLDPGDTFTFSGSDAILFCPDNNDDGAGALNGTINIFNNDPDASPFAVGLVGIEASPEIQVSGDIAFDDTVANSGTNIKTLVISNIGTGVLNWNAAFTDDEGGVFHSISPSSGTLAPSANVNVDISFTPDDTVLFEGELEVTADETDADGDPAAVALTGTGTP